MKQTAEEHNKNLKQKIYQLQCKIPINRAFTGEPADIYYRDRELGWMRYTGYRTAKQVLDAIKTLRKSKLTSWGYPWKWRIKIVK